MDGFTVDGHDGSKVMYCRDGNGWHKWTQESNMMLEPKISVRVGLREERLTDDDRERIRQYEGAPLMCADCGYEIPPGELYANFDGRIVHNFGKCRLGGYASR